MIRIRLKRDLFGAIVTDDTGSALILALAFLIFFSFVGAALLGFVDAAFRGSIAVKDQRKVSYAGDGGVEGAIRYIQGDPTGNRGSSGNCPDFVTNLNGATVTVKCSPYAGSGDPIQGGAGSDSPLYALLALDDTISANGFDQGSGGNLDIDGAILSNSRIAVSSGALLRVTGTVWARGTCDNVRITPDCTTTTTVSTDPQYPPQSDAFVLTNPPAVCTGTTATFAPGKYTVTPEQLDELCLGANSITTHNFLPGAYYFEFPGNGAASRWSTSKKLTGGSQDPTDPNNCLTGVQFIFGAASHLDLQNNSSLYLCAKPPSGQRVALYGAGSLVPLRATDATSTAKSPNTVTFSLPSRAVKIDGVNSTGTVTSSVSTQRATNLTLAGYQGTFNGGPLQSGGDLSRARLRIAHHTGGGNDNQISVTLTVEPGDGGTPAIFVNGNHCGSIANCFNSKLTLSNSATNENVIDLLAGGSNGPGWTSPSKYGSVTATFSAQATSGTRSVRLDGMDLDLIYAPSPFKAVTGTVLLGADPLLKSPNSASFVMKVTGTVYSPASWLDIGLGNDCDQALGRGVISWRLSISLTGGCTPVKSPISLPPTGVTGFHPRQVLLEAFVGCSPGTCQPNVRAKVRFPVGAQPVIDYWTVLRR